MSRQFNRTALSGTCDNPRAGPARVFECGAGSPQGSCSAASIKLLEPATDHDGCEGSTVHSTATGT